MCVHNRWSTKGLNCFVVPTCEKSVCRWSPVVSRATVSKVSRICGLIWSPTAVSRTRPPSVRWNAREGDKLFLLRVLLSITCVVVLAPLSVSVTVPSPALQADSLSIARQSCSGYKRVVSGWFWDIGQIPVRNFDWLPFIPLWSPSPIIQGTKLEIAKPPFVLKYS
jgi:hypothetical protein